MNFLFLFQKLKIRTADVTRSTVQKAVCALVSRPLFGYIEVKLSLIAQSFFDQGDFSNIHIIRTAYDHLNMCSTGNRNLMASQIHVGLSIRDIVLRLVVCFHELKVLRLIHMCCVLYSDGDIKRLFCSN